MAILLFPGMEVLDFAGPYEVFSVAGRIADSATPPFRVVTVAAEAGPVLARHGLRVLPDHVFADVPTPDVLIIPGGVMDQPLADTDTRRWVSAVAEQARLIASVCTGAFLLADIGLLRGRRATTHWEDVADLRLAHPEITVVTDAPFVDEGAIVTSAGISAGIGMSLHLVSRLADLELARRTGRQIEFAWAPPADRIRPAAGAWPARAS